MFFFLKHHSVLVGVLLLLYLQWWSCSKKSCSSEECKCRLVLVFWWEQIAVAVQSFLTSLLLRVHAACLCTHTGISSAGMVAWKGGNWNPCLIKPPSLCTWCTVHVLLRINLVLTIPSTCVWASLVTAYSESSKPPLAFVDWTQQKPWLFFTQTMRTT